MGNVGDWIAGGVGVALLVALVILMVLWLRYRQESAPRRERWLSRVVTVTLGVLVGLAVVSHIPI